MKKIYWRPSKAGWQVHAVLAILAVVSLVLVETYRVRIRRPHYRAKLQAARIMKQGMEVIKEYRKKHGPPIDPAVEPSESGMVGILISPITSNTGSLDAKRTTANPNWAAVMVSLLKRAGVEEGDTVAMGLSGSFPSLNLAAMAAAEALKLNVVSIASVGASTWGANISQLTWLDMESLLTRRKIISRGSVAASLGGQGDRAIGMSKRGKELLRAAIERNGLSVIDIRDPKENLDARMGIYQEHAGQAPITAFVNVGGGSVSVGTAIGKKLFKPGLNLRPPPRAMTVDSLLTRFAREDIPVIHMRMVSLLAARYGLPQVPMSVPAVGEGEIYARMEYNMWLAAALLAILVAALYLLIKRDIGYRLFSGARASGSAKPPEPMV